MFQQSINSHFALAVPHCRLPTRVPSWQCPVGEEGVMLLCPQQRAPLLTGGGASRRPGLAFQPSRKSLGSALATDGQSQEHCEQCPPELCSGIAPLSGIH